MRLLRIILFSAGWAVGLMPAVGHGEVTSGLERFRTTVRPLLETYCFDCHADGANKGNVAFDEFPSELSALGDRELWLQVLKNLRAGLMPPQRKTQPAPAERAIIEAWIKESVFEIDPANPDPGRVTIRRLNRIEYHNTIRDLLGVDFDTLTFFPPDDAGHGFDNIADVLTLPPMLLEKYVLAANQIVNQVVPTAAKVIPEEFVDGIDFVGAANDRPKPQRRRRDFQEPLPRSLSYYQPAAVSNTIAAEFAGRYELSVALLINEKFVDDVFDYNRCRLIFRVDGKVLWKEEFGWEGGKSFHYQDAVDWTKGSHNLGFELQPLTPDQPQTRSLSMQITSVKVSGPMDRAHWVQPENYRRFFPKDVPDTEIGQRVYARELITTFAQRAFRRPPQEKTVGKLVELAEQTYSQPGKTFEMGVAQAMVAILASPRFLFREEQPERAEPVTEFPYVDEFSIASRLSYFLWSSTPDDELLRLAEAGQLRRNLDRQVKRMLADRKAEALVQNFGGQWLRSRDIEGVPIEARAVLAREAKFNASITQMRQRFDRLDRKPKAELSTAERGELEKLRVELRRTGRRPLRAEMSPEIRRAMRQETERYFAYVLKQDRSMLELIDSDYTFLNEKLAEHYGIDDVTGAQMRLVKLPADSPRGGILTQGTVLGVTANPTRTSPVKRGVFVLDNILGTPPPPPPPNIPPLEDSAKATTGHAPSLRETLARHREDPMCASCHNRMDPIGLAFENFNAMGMWRDQEYDEPIDPTGQLITGEEFHDIRELKKILTQNHAMDFYRAVTEKMLIYALGRGLEYYDVETCDEIVAQLAASGGKPSVLINGIIASAPFQKMREPDVVRTASGERSYQYRADLRTRP